MELSVLLSEHLTAVLLGAVGMMVAFVFFNHRRPKNFPPGPNGFPLIGIAPFLGTRPDKKITEYAQKYGDVMGVDMGTHYVLVLSSVEVMNEALAKQGDVYSARPWTYLHDVIWCKNGLSMTDYSEAWKEQRKFVLQSLRKFGFGKTVLEGPIADETRHLSEALRQLGGDYASGKNYIMDAVANVMCKLTLGTRFNYDDDQNFMRYAHNVTKKFQEASFPIQACTLLPWCYLIPPFRGPLRRMKLLFKDLHNTIHDYIEDHKKTLDPDDPRDFLDDYLVEISKKTGPSKGYFNETMLKFILRDLFLGGTETIFSNLSWSMLILANRPDVQKKIHDEIDEIFEDGALPTIQQKEEMHYTMAFMQEMFRYRTLLPFGVARMTTRVTKLAGYDIPKGTTVLPNIYGVHNDPNVWKDPLEFKVERHLDQTGKFVKSHHVIPFGVGYRFCIGKQLAEIEFFLVLMAILQNFDVESGSGKWQFEDLVECGFVSTPPPSTSLKLKERVN